MSTAFDLVLEKFSETSADSIIAQLQQLFISVTKLSPDELVATHQVIDVIGKLVCLKHTDMSTLIDALKNAVIVQMKVVLKAMGTSDIWTLHQLHRRFEDAVGMRIDYNSTF